MSARSSDTAARAQRGLMVDLIKRMVKTRGFSDIVTPRPTDYRAFVVGMNQTGATHPRKRASCIAMIEYDGKYSGTVVQTAIRALHAKAVEVGADESSSLVYVYSFDESDARRQSIEKIYQDMLSDGGLAPLGRRGGAMALYYLEAMPASFFRIDYSHEGASRRWLLEARTEFELIKPKPTRGAVAQSHRTGSIFIDKPPGIYTTDPPVRYIGGRHGDYVSFEKLENLQIGPCYVPGMARVRAKREKADSAQSAAEKSAAGKEEDYQVDTEQVGDDYDEEPADEDAEFDEEPDE